MRISGAKEDSGSVQGETRSSPNSRLARPFGADHSPAPAFRALQGRPRRVTMCVVQ